MALIATDVRLIALSKASGPSSIAPVICLRSAILHNAAASTVDGTVGLNRDAHFLKAQHVREVDRVLDDVNLLFVALLPAGSAPHHPFACRLS
jgi:hypothetical protein